MVETFSEYPSLGRFIVRDTHQTVAIGIILVVNKKDPSERDMGQTSHEGLLSFTLQVLFA